MCCRGSLAGAFSFATYPHPPPPPGHFFKVSKPQETFKKLQKILKNINNLPTPPRPPDPHPPRLNVDPGMSCEKPSAEPGTQDLLSGQSRQFPWLGKLTLDVPRVLDMELAGVGYLQDGRCVTDIGHTGGAVDSTRKQ